MSDAARRMRRFDAEAVIQSIHEEGYCHIEQVLPPDLVKEALARVEGDYDEADRRASKQNVPALAKNDRFIWNLQNKHPFYLEALFGSPELQRVLQHFLNDRWFKQIPQDEPNYILRNYMARSSNMRLPMHIDSLIPYGGDHVFVMQVSYVLQDQSIENGCTYVVPGSHRSGEYARQEAFETGLPVESRAGDVVLWDSRIWHGAGPNRSGAARWALIATWVRWWIKQGFDIPRNLPRETYAALDDSQRAMLGFCSMPFATEEEGIDMKRGYDALAERADGSREPPA